MENEKTPAAEEHRELRLSTKWLLEGCVVMSKELLTQCDSLYRRLDNEDGIDVYDALDARTMADQLHRVLRVIEEREGIGEM